MWDSPTEHVKAGAVFLVMVAFLGFLTVALSVFAASRQFTGIAGAASIAFNVACGACRMPECEDHAVLVSMGVSE